MKINFEIPVAAQHLTFVTASKVLLSGYFFPRKTVVISKNELEAFFLGLSYRNQAFISWVLSRPTKYFGFFFTSWFWIENIAILQNPLISNKTYRFSCLEANPIFFQWKLKYRIRNIFFISDHYWSNLWVRSTTL